MMSMKRDVEAEGDDDGGSFVSDSKRQRTSLDSMKVVMAAQYIQQHLPKIEPFLRKVVQEEVQSAIWRDMQLTRRVHINKIQATVSNRYCLQFRSNLPRTLFTSSKIEAEGQHPVEIVIIDSGTKQIVTFGPLSSLKVEILVLDGDFGVDGQEEWTEKEFSDNIVREREGKRPLLSGELMVNLVKGVGFLGDVNFTDNSSWTRSRRFRLGARVSQNRCNERVQEALSGSFLVKDHRGELYKKHHPPSLTDDVWRLEKIGKDGVFHKRLADNGIVTVQDFLKNFVMDPDKLRLILGTGMSNKMWEATIEHAKKCVIPEEKLYSYNYGQGLVLLFNAINELLGVIIQDKVYCINELSPTQKVFINKLKQDAYRSQGLIMEIIQPMVDNSQRLLPSPTEPFTIPFLRCLDEHLPYNRGDPILDMDSFHLPNLSGNGTTDGLSQIKDMFPGMAYQQLQGSDSLHLNNTSSSCFDMPLSNTDTRGFTEPAIVDDRPISLNSEAEMLCSSHCPMLCDQSNSLLHASECKTNRNCTPDVPQLGAQLYTSQWIKLKAVSKLMTIARRSARRAAFMDSTYPMQPSGLLSDAYGGCW